MLLSRYKNRPSARRSKEKEGMRRKGDEIQAQSGASTLLIYGHKNTTLHSGRMDSKTINSTIDALPGVPVESKNQNFYFTNKSVELLR